MRSNTLKSRASLWASHLPLRFLWRASVRRRSVSVVRLSRLSQRQEGIGVGNGARLHGRGKALEGEPHERIWYEIRPAGPERVKASRGCENLEAPARRVRQTCLIYATALDGDTL